MLWQLGSGFTSLSLVNGATPHSNSIREGRKMPVSPVELPYLQSEAQQSNEDVLLDHLERGLKDLVSVLECVKLGAFVSMDVVIAFTLV